MFFFLLLCFFFRLLLLPLLCFIPFFIFSHAYSFDSSSYSSSPPYASLLQSSSHLRIIRKGSGVHLAPCSMVPQALPWVARTHAHTQYISSNFWLLFPSKIRKIGFWHRQAVCVWGFRHFIVWKIWPIFTKLRTNPMPLHGPLRPWQHALSLVTVTSGRDTTDRNTP